ncbi:carboxypeptidase S [Stachybotrys elegans]|uniref:Carboxypeptidase S n=1 Tax=Stachybotrys elegans TaxID=80388 RepID=A0A8K0STW4_9HYPO|nr:carboxypeptidase S [Stachybotrys elegans]
MASYEKLPMQPQLPNVATMPVKKSASSRRRRLLLVPDFKAQCPQVEPIQPKHQTQALSDMESYFSTVKFRNESVARLSGAVKIPSESYDDLGPVGEDKRWDTMYDVAAYLKATFPAVHEYLELEKVNTHGLLFTWKGSDPSLKPTVLMAHQDVVPVAQATVSQWTHPPYSGHYDGAYVWGRGASDCKNTLVGILEAVEMLINAGFTPKRTLILSFGFDEESSGREGAGHLSNTLMERYGKDGVAMIVDEGSGNVPTFGTYFAVPAVAEKGYIDVDVIVRMPGGHSSIPPPHTGIGVMSEFITMIESNPYEPHIADENPFMNILQCGAAYGPEFPDDWKKLMPSGHHTGAKKDKLARAVAEASRPMKYLFTTSVAVDVVGGGVKANALPERTTALVNHRINIGSSSADIKKHLTKLASKLADKYDLAVNAFEGDETQSSITLRASNNTLEPAPITPTETDSLNPFVLLSGTIKALYGDKLQISPALMTGNTDTRYYWGLSKHIFRYIPGWDPEEAGNLDGVHTVDERVSVTGHVNGVKWFTLFIRNIDEAELP